jgi:hypothetical protein
MIAATIKFIFALFGFVLIALTQQLSFLGLAKWGVKMHYVSA